MAPQAAKAVDPPKTLPPDFFEKQGAPSTLPGNFDFGDKPPAIDSDTFGGAVGNVVSRVGSNIGALAKPFLHPSQIPEMMAGNMGNMVRSVTRGEPSPDLVSDFRNTYAQDKPKAFENLAGDVATGALMYGAGKIPQIPKALGGIRDAAIGDPNAAALRGLQIGPKSPKTLQTLKSVEGARPFLQGAQSMEDLQARIPGAKSEIWGPYQQAVDAIGDRPIKGPDGMTTVGALEDERKQLSALNRDLKSKTPNPESVQLAQQKGLNQAQLLAKEKAVKMALMPELAKTGIDPKGILKAFGQVSDVGSKVSGKSTLIEPAQPSGFGKIANISIKQPLQAPAQIASGVRDLVAGRPLWEAKPSDLGIKEAFRSAGPKPNLGAFRQPTVKGLLPAPMEDIPLHDPFVEPHGHPGVFDASISASRTGAPLTTPEGNPNYAFSDQSPELPATKGILQQGVLRRRSTK